MKFRRNLLSASIAATFLLAGVASAQEAATPTAVAAPQDAAATAPPAQDKKARNDTSQSKIQTLNAVVVTGIARSQDQDIALKRYAPQIQDSITAQDIGQLPDITISDSLSRVPGVQIGRSGGEGSTVSINGLPQVATTLNGEAFLSPGGGSGLLNGGAPDLDAGTPDFVVIPPTMFSGADVIKSITASNISGGVSGIINLKTHRPFDFHPGWTFSGSAQGFWGDRSQHFNKQASALASYHNDTWGALLTASWSDETIQNEVPRIAMFDGGLKTTKDDVGFDWGGGSDFFYNWDPKRIGTATTERKRKGLNGAFQYKISDSLTFVADAMFTQLKERDVGYNMLLQDDSAPANLQAGPVAPIISPNGNLLRGIDDVAQLTQFTTVAHGPANSFNTNLELDFDDGGMFTGSLRWVHGKAHRDFTSVGANANINQGSELLRPDGTVEFDNPAGLPNGIPVLMDFRGTYPSIDILQNVTNPAQWVLTSAYASANRIRADQNVLRADGALHFDDGVFDSLQFGGRYERRSYILDNYYYLTPVFPPGSCADPTGPGPLDNYSRYVDPRLTDSCTGFSPLPSHQLTDLPAGYWRYFSDFDPLHVTGVGVPGVGIPAVNANVMNDPVAFIQSVAPSWAGPTAKYRDPTSSYVVTEKRKAVYAQLNLNGDLGDMSWSGNAGLRAVRTTLSIGNYITNGDDYIGNGGSWNGVLINQGRRTQVDEHTSYLPALNFALEVTDNQQLRFAWNKTEARQALSDLGRGLQVFYSANGNPPRDPSLPQSAQLFENAVSGNPNLKPYRSSNYNLSYAWYFTPHSIAYLGAFLMDVSSFPENATISEELPDADGVVRRSGPVSTVINGGGSIVRGLEGQFTTQFTQLPGIWSGLGVNFNYTYLHSSNAGAAGSANSYNAVVFYDKYDWQLRLAYNWQGKAFAFTNSSTGDDLNVYTKAVGYLDMSVEYRVNKHLSILFQGTNLTDEHDQQYIQYPNAWYADNISERRYYAGVRLSF